MAIEVVRKDNSALVAFACGSCGQLFQIIPEPDEATGVARSKKLADDCCPPKVCPQCSANPVVRGQPLCTACAAKASADVESRRFSAASKLREADWKQEVYWPLAPFDGDRGGKYWSSIEKLRKDCSSRVVPVPVPPYVYATKPVPLAVSAADVIEKALEEHSESTTVPATEAAKLQKLLDDWAKGQKVATFIEDLSRAVVLG